MRERAAIIDLGTNTFHLFIVEMNGPEINTLYKEKIAVKIGKNGISKGRIAAEAKKRAIHTLRIFRTVIDLFEVQHVKGVATSAIRSAKNGADLIEEIREKTQINIDIISGTKEAELIFRGVQAAMELSETPQLVMDIGGGSVEFIIGSRYEILWRHSFEIGAQRLLDQFHQIDPIPEDSIASLNAHLSEALLPLIRAIEEYKPTGLIGCSGTFDTLIEIFFQDQKIARDINQKAHSLSVTDYQSIHENLLSKTRAERLSIPGMVSMRVDMIVVASCLIRFVLDHIETESITACSYALKEGLLYSSFEYILTGDSEVTQS